MASSFGVSIRSVSFPYWPLRRRPITLRSAIYRSKVERGIRRIRFRRLWQEVGEPRSMTPSSVANWRVTVVTETFNIAAICSGFRYVEKTSLFVCTQQPFGRVTALVGLPLKSPQGTPDSRLNQVSVFGCGQKCRPLLEKNQNRLRLVQLLVLHRTEIDLGAQTLHRHCGHDPCSREPARRPATVGSTAL